MINKYSPEVLNSIKSDILALLRTIDRENADIEVLINKLETSDFFYAPASIKYHNCFTGGLADHSLNVYYNLKSMVKSKGLEDQISEDSIIICSILHDFSKINFYEKSIRNKKVYTDHGSKYDNLGTYDWVSEECYSVKPESERFIYGNHEETSEFMVRTFIPLTLAESIAILNHHGGMGFDSIKLKSPITNLYNKYPLACLLHLADMMSTYVDESY